MLLDLEKFRNDIFKVSEKLCKKLTDKQIQKLSFVGERLIELYQQNLVKINHSVLELICASEFIRYGYGVDVEKKLSDILVCDIFAKKWLLRAKWPEFFKTLVIFRSFLHNLFYYKNENYFLKSNW